LLATIHYSLALGCGDLPQLLKDLSIPGDDVKSPGIEEVDGMLNNLPFCKIKSIAFLFRQGPALFDRFADNTAKVPEFA
jgi:hypothetical protein